VVVSAAATPSEARDMPASDRERFGAFEVA
jgi:hypothetical protein